MQEDSETPQDYPAGFTSTLRDAFARKWLDESDVAYVERPTLTAFVTGDESVTKYWDHVIDDGDLANRWKKCARMLHKYLPALANSGYLEDARAAVKAIKDIAKRVKIRGDNKIPAFPIPKMTLSALAHSAMLLKFLGETIIKHGSMEEFSDPLRFETLHHKARPLFTPHRRSFDFYGQIPKEALESAVIPVLEEIGVPLNAANPVAQGWERLGHIFEDARRKENGEDEKNIFPLSSHISLAMLLCESKQAETIRVPHHVIYDLRTAWRERAPSFKHSSEVFAAAADSIGFQLAPWFDMFQNEPRTDNAPEI